MRNGRDQLTRESPVPRGRRLTAAIVALLALAIPSGHVDTVDAGTRLLEARAILLEGTVRIPGEWVTKEMGLVPSPLHPHPDGTYRSPYGIGLPILWLPFVAAGWGLHRLTGVGLDVAAAAAVSYANLFVVSALLLVIWRLQARLDIPVKERRLTLLFLLVGTNTLSFANSSWSEPLAALCALGGFGVLALRRDAKAAVACGACLAYATLVKPELVLLLPPAVLLLRGLEPRAACGFLATASAGPVFLALSNWTMRGAPLRFEYLPGTYTPTWPLHGALGTLFGETGLLLFDPALLLGAAGFTARDLPPALRRLRLPLALAWAALFLMYASKRVWWGGLTFGPRFHYTLVPLTLLAAPFAVRALLARVGTRPAVAAGLLASAFLLPLQVSGLSVRTNQAQEVVAVTGGPRWRAHLRLLGLKLRRGPSAPELYRKSDFVALAEGEADVVIDHRSFRTFQYLDHAPALLLAWRLRGGARPRGNALGPRGFPDTLDWQRWKTS